MKPNAAASETTASDRRARGGGVIDTLAEANGSVLAAHGGRRPRNMEAMFLGGGVWAKMEVPRVGGEVARMGKSPPRELKNISRHIISYFI